MRVRVPPRGLNCFDGSLDESQISRGSSVVERWFHTPDVGGSIPPCATGLRVWPSGQARAFQALDASSILATRSIFLGTCRSGQTAPH